MNHKPPPIEPRLWKPSKALSGLAIRRCEWVNCDAINAIQPTDEWLATIIVGCYYQGLTDGIKHMARKQRATEVRPADTKGEANE